jgi:diaminopimelate decarboxylase
MHHFQYQKDELYCEEVPVSEIARNVGTPFYLYSHATLRKHFRAFDGAFSDLTHLTCFSMKSNSSLAILRLFAGEGGGVDIVSGGELYRALKAGVDPQKIVYSGVGKSIEDLKYALKSNILLFNVESSQEISLLNDVAKDLGEKAPVAIRVNPDIDPKTHPYVATGLKESKFGIDIRESLEEYARATALDHLVVSGVSCHLGSQLVQTDPVLDALKELQRLIKTLRQSGITLSYLDLGGGLGITYDNEDPPLPEEYANAIQKALDIEDLTLILEPGRVIMGNGGILVTKVLYTKDAREKRFTIVDAGMNDLIRPSLYGSFHGVQPVKTLGRKRIKMDIVGPICESGDFFAKDRDVETLEPGELLAIMSSGAYGFSMSSNYNSRPRVAEVMVKGGQYDIIRSRETYEDLVKGERIPDFLL